MEHEVLHVAEQDHLVSRPTRLVQKRRLTRITPPEDPYAPCHILPGRLEILPESRHQLSEHVFRGMWSKPDSEGLDVVVKHLNIKPKLRSDKDKFETPDEAIGVSPYAQTI